MTSTRYTIRRNGTRLSVTLWAGTPTDDDACEVATSALAPCEALVLAGSQGRTFRYLVGRTTHRRDDNWQCLDCGADLSV